MQKEQNVIKFILIILVCNLSYSQSKIIGKYSNLMPYQEHYNYFDFNKDGTFDYHSGSCLGDSESGKGHYQIKNDSLILNYDLTELKTNDYHKYKTYRNNKDSILIKINVSNLDNKKLSNVSVAYMEKKYGVLTDSDGNAYLKLKKQNKNIEISVSTLYYQNYVFQINTTLNYEISCFLRELPNTIRIKNQIIKYKIVRLKDDYIKLKTDRGGVMKLVRSVMK